MDATFLEIYRENVRDLFQSPLSKEKAAKDNARERATKSKGKAKDSQSLKVREHPVTGAYVEGLLLKLLV